MYFLPHHLFFISSNEIITIKLYYSLCIAPMWNENSQVYQLDFGGRVTQESAKNFQIEFRGKQVSLSFSLVILC